MVELERVGIFYPLPKQLPLRYEQCIYYFRLCRVQLDGELRWEVVPITEPCGFPDRDGFVIAGWEGKEQFLLLGCRRTGAYCGVARRFTKADW